MWHFDFSDVEGFAQYYGLSEKEVDGMLASIVKEINEYGYEDVFGHSYGSVKERFLVESVLDAFYSSDPEQQSLFINLQIHLCTSFMQPINYW